MATGAAGDSRQSVRNEAREKTPAQHLDTMAELVCSNSLRSDRLTNAVGLLKAEMRLLGSLIMRVADETAVPAGGALAVDRDHFSEGIDQAIHQHPLITVIPEEVTEIPTEGNGHYCYRSDQRCLRGHPAHGGAIFTTQPPHRADSLDMDKNAMIAGGLSQRP